MTRAQLLATYDRPYRRALPGALRATQADVALIGATTLTAATLALRESRGIPGWSVALVLGFLAFALLYTALVVTRAVRAVRRRVRPAPTELDALRRNRPHAAGPADTVHDEYAATEDGEVWCFMPLAANQRAVEGETLVPGVPSYAAAPVDRLPADEARETAADWEAEAASGSGTA